jgi:RecA-family ATPase
MKPGAAVNDLRALMEASNVRHDTRWWEHYRDIPRLVRGAEKPEPAPLGVFLRAYEPTPYKDIPRRVWLHAGHYIRQQLMMTASLGAYGKTTVVLTNAIEMAINIGLIGPPPNVPDLRVLYWNGEDPDTEIERRIAAICFKYTIDREKMRGRFFLGSKLARGRRLAGIDRNKIVIDDEVLAIARQFIADNKIDVVIFDPLVAFHSAPESDNMTMDQVVRSVFDDIATDFNCCVELSHHMRKNVTASASGDLNADDTRGAGAIVNAARSVRVINRMSKQQATLPNIPEHERQSYLAVRFGKVNMVPFGEPRWLRLVGVELPNGDYVQAVEAWQYPTGDESVSADDKRWLQNAVRTNPNYLASPQAKENWIGDVLAERLDLNTEDKDDRARLNQILKRLFEQDVLAKDRRADPVTRQERVFVNAGDWVEAGDDDAAF